MFTAITITITNYITITYKLLLLQHRKGLLLVVV